MSVCFVCLEKTNWKVCFTCSAVAHPECWSKYVENYDFCSVCRSENIIRKPKTRARKPKTYSKDLILKIKYMYTSRKCVIDKIRSNINEISNGDNKDTKIKYLIEIMHILIAFKDCNDSKNILLNTKFKGCLKEWFSRNHTDWNEANAYKNFILN